MKSLFDQDTRLEIIKRIESLNKDSKARWGKMTPEQMVRHCAVCEDYYQGKIQVKRSLLGRIIGRLAIKSILKDETTLLKKNTPTASQFKVDDDRLDLEHEKRKWKSLIERYETYGKDKFTHWFFGDLTKTQLGQFIYKHSDHHLRQFGA